MEYVSLLSGADLGVLVCSGVCDDLGTEGELTAEPPVIADLVSGKSGQGFDTVFAVDKAGERYELSPAALPAFAADRINVMPVRQFKPCLTSVYTVFYGFPYNNLVHCKGTHFLYRIGGIQYA